MRRGHQLVGVWPERPPSAKIKTAKISSEESGRFSSKICTSENFPLYGMATGKHDGQTLQHCQDNFLHSYHTNPNATTGVTPCTLFLSRNIRTRFDLLKIKFRKVVLPESRLSRKANMTIMHANTSPQLERKLWSRICD